MGADIRPEAATDPENIARQAALARQRDTAWADIVKTSSPESDRRRPRMG